LKGKREFAMTLNTLSIGAAARAAGVSTPTIRYYEEIGLIPPADRTAAGQRVYGRTDVERLRFIRRARDFGFSIEEVRTLANLAISPAGDCSDVRDIARRQLGEVRARLTDLAALEKALAGFVGLCDASCAGGPADACAVFEVMGEREAAR
jgi:MerR family copper efflux transcriptional regulator